MDVTDTGTEGTGDGDGDEHVAVVNGEGQHSVWPAAQPLPPGWREAGFRGSRDACLDHIEQVWTDMRPRSVRAHAAAGNGDLAP